MRMLTGDEGYGRNMCKGWDIKAGCGFVVHVILHFLKED